MHISTMNCKFLSIVNSLEKFHLQRHQRPAKHFSMAEITLCSLPVARVLHHSYTRITSSCSEEPSEQAEQWDYTVNLCVELASFGFSDQWCPSHSWQFTITLVSHSSTCVTTTSTFCKSALHPWKCNRTRPTGFHRTSSRQKNMQRFKEASARQARLSISLKRNWSTRSSRENCENCVFDS